MSICVNEVSIVRYNSSRDNNRVMFSKVIKRDEYCKMNALSRLCKYYETKENNLLKYVPTQAVIKKMKKDSHFTDMGETIYSKKINCDFEKHKKAVKRLAKYLEYNEKDKNIYYIGTLELEKTGEHYYTISSKYFEIYDNDDRKRKLKNSISGKKGTLTKTINKAKKIRREYADTLIVDGYRNDNRYKKLVNLAWTKRENLRKAKRKTFRDIPLMSAGSLFEKSKKSFDKLSEIVNKKR